MSPRSIVRLDLAYTNKKRPIGWWEANREVVSLVQAYLGSLGYALPESQHDSVAADGEKTTVTDGIFGPETFDAVRRFQKDRNLTQDGMVGKDTLDALASLLDKPRPASNGFYGKASFDSIVRPCRPNDLICPDPSQSQ